MMASTHISLGLSGWIAYANMRGLPLQPLPLLLAGAASLFPDIDHPKSTFGRWVPFLSYPISAIFGHRGITHSFLAVFAAAGFVWFYGGTEWFVTPIVIGYISHIVGDVFTNSGAPLLWPRKDKISFPLFNTGSLVESWIRLMLLAFTMWMIWSYAKVVFKNS